MVGVNSPVRTMVPHYMAHAKPRQHCMVNPGGTSPAVIIARMSDVPTSQVFPVCQCDNGAHGTRMASRD